MSWLGASAAVEDAAERMFDEMGWVLSKRSVSVFFEFRLLNYVRRPVSNALGEVALEGRDFDCI